MMMTPTIPVALFDGLLVEGISPHGGTPQINMFIQLLRRAVAAFITAAAHSGYAGMALWVKMWVTNGTQHGFAHGKLRCYFTL